MGPFAAGTSSISTSLNQASSSLPALAPSSKVSFVRRKTGSFYCKSSTEGGEVTVKDEEASPSPNPFSSGKISSRVKVKKPPAEPESGFNSPFSTSSLPPAPPEVSSPFSPSSQAFSPSSQVSSPFSTSALPSSPFENRAPSPPVKKPEVKTPASGSPPSSGKISSRVKVRTDGSSSKAFKAPPTIASPFDTNPVPRDPTMNKRGITMIPEMDERVLESRKKILKELYSERKSDTMMNAAPADIFDEPKPLLPGEDTFKFELIKGVEPYILLISFSLITALMFGTAFVAYKLGAFHYNEL